MAREAINKHQDFFTHVDKVLFCNLTDESSFFLQKFAFRHQIFGVGLIFFFFFSQVSEVYFFLSLNNEWSFFSKKLPCPPPISNGAPLNALT